MGTIGSIPWKLGCGPAFAHASDRLHEEVSADYNDMIYAASKPEIEAKRKAFIRKWRLKCHAVAASLEEAGDKLFTFARFPKSQWKSIRTSNTLYIATSTATATSTTAALTFDTNGQAAFGTGTLTLSAGTYTSCTALTTNSSGVI